MPLRAIVFDFDGVIADTERLHYRAFRDVLERQGIDLTERDYYARYLGYSDAGAFAAVGTDFGRTWPGPTIAALVADKSVRMGALEGAELFPGAEAFVRDLSARVPIAIASGALRADIVRVLDRVDLARCFRAIVAAEDVTASKPSPEPYRRAVDLLSTSTGHTIRPGACIAIEDSRWGLESARAAGLRTIALTHSYRADDLAIADLVVAGFPALSFTDLSQLIQNTV